MHLTGMICPWAGNLIANFWKKSNPHPMPLSCFAFIIEKNVPNRINKASLPPNLYQLPSTIFSNLMDHTILCRASDRLRKKVKFHGIFRGKFAEKSTNFAGIFGANLAENQSVKKSRFCGYFQGKLR